MKVNWKHGLVLAWAVLCTCCMLESSRADDLALAATIYHEARGEPRKGQVAVACVVLNRVNHPRWPGTTSAVAYQRGVNGGYRFTWLNKFRSGAPYSARAWEIAMSAAREAALPGVCNALIGDATYYSNVRRGGVPWWVKGERLKWAAQIGRHTFWSLPTGARRIAGYKTREIGSRPVLLAAGDNGGIDTALYVW